MYSKAEVEKMIQRRLHQHKKETAQPQPQEEVEDHHQQKTPDKDQQPHIMADLQDKLKAEKQRNKALAEKHNRMVGEIAKSKVEKAISSHNFIEPEMVLDHFLHRGLVKWDDEGELEVANATGDLDDLIREYAESKPHLVKGKSSGGIGSKAPSPMAPASGNHSLDDLERALGITSKPKGKLFKNA